MNSVSQACLSAAIFTLLSSAALCQEFGPPTVPQGPPFSVPNDGYAVEGRPGPPGSGFVLREKPTAVPWEPFAGPGIPAGLQRRLLSQSPSVGAVSQITYVPPGWSRPVGHHNVDDEIVVLEGDLSIGDDRLTKYSYSFIPAGVVHGPVTSRQGAVLLNWWKGKPDFVASDLDKKGARDYARVRDWNLYKKSWYVGKPFPDYRAGGNISGYDHILMREDPDTGETTWMTFGASIPAPSNGRPGVMGSVFEIHPSFEEYFWLEKTNDSVIEECLNQGRTSVTFGDRTYWWRPAGVGHGGPKFGEDSTAGYAISLVRTGTRLWATYVTDCNYKAGSEYMGAGKGWRKYDYNVPRYKVQK